jgi:hypothetical protein
LLLAPALPLFAIICLLLRVSFTLYADLAGTLQTYIQEALRSNLWQALLARGWMVPHLRPRPSNIQALESAEAVTHHSGNRVLCSRHLVVLLAFCFCFFHSTSSSSSSVLLPRPDTLLVFTVWR